tara:strand:- start:1306 stop:1695 length:390 start_codon:yes stop_codon:yes gene_type:complete
MSPTEKKNEYVEIDDTWVGRDTDFDIISQIAYEEDGRFICCECCEDFTDDVDKSSSFTPYGNYYETSVDCSNCNENELIKNDDGRFICCECKDEYKGDGEIKLLRRIICKDCYVSECLEEYNNYYEWIK